MLLLCALVGGVLATALDRFGTSTAKKRKLFYARDWELHNFFFFSCPLVPTCLRIWYGPVNKLWYLHFQYLSYVAMAVVNVFL